MWVADRNLSPKGNSTVVRVRVPDSNPKAIVVAGLARVRVWVAQRPATRTPVRKWAVERVEVAERQATDDPAVRPVIVDLVGVADLPDTRVGVVRFAVARVGEDDLPATAVAEVREIDARVEEDERRLRAVPTLIDRRVDVGVVERTARDVTETRERDVAVAVDDLPDNSVTDGTSASWMNATVKPTPRPQSAMNWRTPVGSLVVNCS